MFTVIARQSLLIPLYLYLMSKLKHPYNAVSVSNKEKHEAVKGSMELFNAPGALHVNY